VRILVDTNILIPLEPTGPDDVEPGTPAAVELVRLTQQSHVLVVHPSSVEELANDPNEHRRELRLLLVGKYTVLDQPPRPNDAMRRAIPEPAPASHDAVDYVLLAAVYLDAVEMLVTDDERIHGSAKTLGISNRVLRLVDAVETLRALVGTTPTPPPFVRSIPAHALDDSDVIFASFRQDYPPFDTWLTKAKRDGRPAWVIDGSNGAYAGVCIVKDDDDEEGIGGRVLKVSSFKVADEYQGNRYGELLIKTVLLYCRERSFDAAWVTVFPRHETLRALLDDFGFVHIRTRNNGEFVYVKRLRWDDADRVSLEPLEFHVTFGPPALKVDPADTFIVPIQPRYHELLFPDAEPQAQLISRPFGNAIRKAYLCRSGTRALRPGSSLVFYRSGRKAEIRCVGIVESTLVSSDADEVVRAVGQRTVYSYDEIKTMCHGDVLAIIFRQDHILTPAIGRDELIEHLAVRQPPQTIMAVRDEGAQWLTQRISA
jgi:GNAT superfamily N-acetyltransferase